MPGRSGTVQFLIKLEEWTSLAAVRDWFGHVVRDLQPSQGQKNCHRHWISSESIKGSHPGMAVTLDKPWSDSCSWMKSRLGTFNGWWLMGHHGG